MQSLGMIGVAWKNNCELFFECESVPYHTRFQDTVYLESVGIAFPAISENVSCETFGKRFSEKCFWWKSYFLRFRCGIVFFAIPGDPRGVKMSCAAFLINA